MVATPRFADKNGVSQEWLLAIRQLDQTASSEIFLLLKTIIKNIHYFLGRSGIHKMEESVYRF